MTLWNRLRSWLQSTLHRSCMENEMDTELRFHLESFADDLIRSGVPRQEALRRALAPQESRLHGGCRPDSRSRHRCQHRHLQPRQRNSPRWASLPPIRTARERHRNLSPRRGRRHARANPLPGHRRLRRRPRIQPHQLRRTRSSRRHDCFCRVFFHSRRPRATRPHSFPGRRSRRSGQLRHPQLLPLG